MTVTYNVTHNLEIPDEKVFDLYEDTDLKAIHTVETEQAEEVVEHELSNGTDGLLTSVMINFTNPHLS